VGRQEVETAVAKRKEMELQMKRLQEKNRWVGRAQAMD
jgi:hypothetical protein